MGNYTLIKKVNGQYCIYKVKKWAVKHSLRKEIANNTFIKKMNGHYYIYM